MRVAVFVAAIAVGVLAMFAAIVVAPAGGKEAARSIAPPATEDNCMCGNQAHYWYYLNSSPPGGSHVGSWGSPCPSPGAISYTWNDQYRYTVQCT